MAQREIMPVPQELLHDLNYKVLTAEVRAAVGDEDFVWHTERLVEAAYQKGYGDGYVRRLGDESARRVADESLARRNATEAEHGQDGGDRG